MLELLKTRLARIENDTLGKINLLREYLQLLILKFMDEKGYFRHLAFVGGTALRILYNLNRFSEDLDFCLIDKENYSLTDMMQEIEKWFQLQNLKIIYKTKADKTVMVGFIKFPDLPYHLGITHQVAQRLLIKIEIDQNPPSGYKTTFTMVNKDFLLGINHYDLPSLYASKLHAVLHRKYAKGRDFYDFLWYASKKVEPNYQLLENAIYQTEKKVLKLDKTKLAVLLNKKLNEVDFKKIAEDVKPFLVDPSELRFFDKKHFLTLISE